MDIRIDVPPWIDELAAAHRERDTVEGRMALAIALSRENVERGGGPFGAVVFAGDELVAAGVNLVLTSGLSIAHAEIVTLLRAQRRLAAGAPPEPPYTLYTSAEPCCQCFGALVWSGVHELVCGAATKDVEAIGFDEGPKPQPWDTTLIDKGFSVTQGVGRDAAVEVLQEYARRGGAIYGLGGPTFPPGAPR